jgi:hypothetical protein
MKKNENEEIVNVRYEFHKTKRLNRLMKVQNSLYPFSNVSSSGKTMPDRGYGTVADGGKLSRSLATLFNKSKHYLK